jgi:hypothetical protein
MVPQHDLALDCTGKIREGHHGILGLEYVAVESE